MDRRLFGSTGLMVSPIGLGCARIGGIFQQKGSGFLDLLAAALDAGINFFDTADMYSQGESESLLGRAFKGKRERVVIASKVGFRLPAQRRLIAAVKPFARPLIKLLGLKRENLPAAVSGKLSQDFSPAYLRLAVEGSLRRLGTDRIELLQLHSPPLAVIEGGEWRETLEGLKKAGKILHWGIACDTLDDARAALRQPGLESVQLSLSLVESEALRSPLPELAQAKVGVIAREIFANGILAKSPPPTDLSGYTRTPAEAERRARQLSMVGQLARDNHCAPGRLALQLVQRTPGVSVALVGARSVEQLTSALTWADGALVPMESLAAIGAVA